MARGEVTYFEHANGSACKDRHHRRCTGRWRGELNLGSDGQGRRVRRKASAGSKAELLTKLTELRQEVEQGIRSAPSYTVGAAAENWLAGPKRTVLLIAGLVELRIAGKDEDLDLCFTTVNSLSSCDLAYLVGAMLGTAAEGIVAIEERGGMTAQEWLAAVRERFSPSR